LKAFIAAAIEKALGVRQRHRPGQRLRNRGAAALAGSSRCGPRGTPSEEGRSVGVARERTVRELRPVQVSGYRRGQRVDFHRGVFPALSLANSSPRVREWSRSFDRRARPRRKTPFVGHVGLETVDGAGGEITQPQCSAPGLRMPRHGLGPFRAIRFSLALTLRARALDGVRAALRPVSPVSAGQEALREGARNIVRLTPSATSGPYAAAA
jgi:hypothetical protein